MDEQLRSSRRDSSRPSSQGRRSQVGSLDCYSSSNLRSSNRNRPSLIQVMSLNSNDLKEQSIYESYLIEEYKRPGQRNSNNSQVSNQEQNSMEPESPILRPRSMSNRAIGHDCQCDDNNCLGFHCSCYNEPNQICLFNSCCPNCIKMKNQTLITPQQHKPAPTNRATKTLLTKCMCGNNFKNIETTNKECVCGFYALKAAAHQKAQLPKSKATTSTKTHKSNAIVCSCKKSHCLKKYCACYAAGMECSPECECEDCQNHTHQGDDRDERFDEKLRFGRADTDQNEPREVDIEQYLQDKNYQNEMMPVRMQFQHPDMRNAYHA